MGKYSLPLKTLDRGQTLIESLFFMIFVLSFLLTVQVFQSIARKEIQKQRLTSEKTRAMKRSFWYYPRTVIKNQEIFSN